MNDKEGMFKSGKSIARNSSAPLFRGKENKGFSKVVESINRINRATELLEPGWHGSVRLSPYRQQEGTTCFFSGAIVVARDFFGVDIPETPLAAKARRLGLLNEAGARTAEEDKRSALEKFVKNETGVTIKFRGHSWGNREEDLQILDVLVQRGNLASVLYPLTDNSHEWETFFGVSKVISEEGVRWYSNFSPAGIIKERSTPEMAQLLYRRPHKYLLICEIEVQTPL